MRAAKAPRRQWRTALTGENGATPADRGPSLKIVGGADNQDRGPSQDRKRHIGAGEPPAAVVSQMRDGESVDENPDAHDGHAHDGREHDALDAARAEIAALTPEERSSLLLDVIVEGLEGDKAEDIVTIPLAGKSEIADSLVVASGRSQRHVGAMADKIVRQLKEKGFGRAKVEGANACDWVLIDAGDVIAHLFRPEVRAFYNLERVWSEEAHAPARADA